MSDANAIQQMDNREKSEKESVVSEDETDQELCLLAASETQASDDEADTGLSLLDNASKNHANQDGDNQEFSSIDEASPIREDETVASVKSGKSFRGKSDDEPAISDDDMQGYDTRSEVASSVSGDSDTDDEDGGRAKSFNVKRKKRHSIVPPINSSPRKLHPPSSPLKKNSAEYLSQLNFLFRDARFFIIKSSNSENVALSKSRGVWATLPQNQIKLSEAFRSSQNVILIYSAKESGKFCGFARLATGIDRTISPVPWIVPAELTPNLLEGTFRVDWICRKDLPFSFTTTLFNPWNRNKPVKIARDGQEIEPRIGEKLCRLFPEDEDVDLTPIFKKSKEAARNLPVRPKNEIPSQGMYTSKYRSRMNDKERYSFAHRVHDSGRVSKNYRVKGFAKVGEFATHQVYPLEAYMKRFAPHFRPPFPLPFVPSSSGGGGAADIFPHFAPVLFPHNLPRYLDHAAVFSQFPKLPPLLPPKNRYNRSLDHHSKKSGRDREYYLKTDDRSRHKDGGKGRRSHYRDRL